MTRTAVRTTTSSFRRVVGRGFAAAAVLGLAMLPVGAVADTGLGGSGDVETQRIEGWCQIAPRLPFICVDNRR